MNTIPTTVRLRAWICRICPFCMAKRAFPRSLYARFLTRVERNCPFCKAYQRLHKQEKDGQGAQSQEQGGP